MQLNHQTGPLKARLIRLPLIPNITLIKFDAVLEEASIFLLKCDCPVVLLLRFNILNPVMGMMKRAFSALIFDSG